MKKREYAIVTVVFAAILALALAGGTWTTSLAVGTVPEHPPAPGRGSHIPARPRPAPRPHPPRRSVIPVTGACATGGDIENIGNVALCIPDNGMDKAYEVDIEAASTIPAADQMTPLSAVVNIYLVDGNKVLPNYRFKSASTLAVILTSDVLDQFEKNGKACLMWYDPQKNKWVKIDSTVEGGQLTAMVPTTGLFVLAVPK